MVELNLGPALSNSRYVTCIITQHTHVCNSRRTKSQSYADRCVCVWQEGLGKVGRSKLENQDKFLKDYLKYNH